MWGLEREEIMATIHKWFWAWDFDKEEKWLNVMADKGLSLIYVGFCTYVFEKSNPGEYEIRMEILENVPTHSESIEYISLVEESGAQYLGAVTRWVYFRRKKDKGSFELFSDFNSRIQHLNRIMALISTILGVEVLCSIINLNALFYPGTGLIAKCFAILIIIINLLVFYGLIKVYRKKHLLIKEKQLFD